MTAFIYPIRLASGRVLRVHLVPFVPTAFNEAEFGAEGIAFPESILRSVRARQAEFFHGRVAAHAALREIGAPATEVPIGVAREPVWPARLVGSISHVENLAGAVAGIRAHHVGLGIDIESVARGDSQAALRQIATTKEENVRIQAAAGTLSIDELFTLVFSAKECLFKAAYATVGRFFGFEAALFAGIDEVRSVVTLEIADYLHSSFPRGRRCEVSFTRLDAETFLTAFEAAGK